MPGPLSSAKHELFAQELAKGRPQYEAYKAAGYKPSESHASRLASNGKVLARVNELLATAAAETVTTIHDIARQLDEDRTFARDLEAPAAAISATMGKAKVLGLLNDKVEVTGKDGESLAPSAKEVAARIAFILKRSRKAA